MVKPIHPGFEISGRHHHKSKTGISVVPQKGLMSSKTKILKSFANAQPSKNDISISYIIVTKVEIVKIK